MIFLLLVESGRLRVVHQRCTPTILPKLAPQDKIGSVAVQLTYPHMTLSDLAVSTGHDGISHTLARHDLVLLDQSSS
jgi:hypothetical protein